MLTLDTLRGWMQGEDCVVVGCGPSATACHTGYEFDCYWTLSCNRAVTLSYPDFAVCVEPKRDAALWETVTKHAPLIVFSHLDSPHPRSVRIGSKDVQEWVTVGTPWVKWPLTLPQAPFFAAACAILLGFETIGLIGVDLDPEPDEHGNPTRFGDRDVAKSLEAYGRLADIAAAQGSRLINLSPDSRLTSVEQGTWQDIRTK